MISSVEYRIAADDVLGQTAALGALNGELAEQPRSNARYMTGTIPVAGTATAWIGREALIIVPLPGGSQLPSKEERANIDLVVGAFDTTSRANGARRLNPNRFDVSITGSAFGATTGMVNSFDFSAFPTYEGVRGFLSVASTRAVYENDVRHDNRVNAPVFHYNITNSPNLTGGNQIQGGMVGADKDFYWNTDARTGTAAFTKDDANDATSNANSAFPDDVYTIRIGAADFFGNRGTREYRVVLQNWRRTIETSTTNHSSTDSFQITGGSQYRSNQSVGIHVVPATGSRPASGRSFSDAIMSTTVVTDANGNIPAQSPMDPASPAPRQYFVIADYDGDGVFTPGLDAFKVISFGPPPIVRGASESGGTNGGELLALDTGGVQMAIESIMFGDVPAPYFYYSPSWEKYFVLTPPHAVGSVGVSLVLANSQTIVVEDSETNDPLEYEFYQQTLEASAAQNPAPYGSSPSVTVSLAGAAASMPDDDVYYEIYIDGATVPYWTGDVWMVDGAAQIDMSGFNPGIYHIYAVYLGDWGLFGDDDDPRTDMVTEYTFIIRNSSMNQTPVLADDFFGSPHGAAKVLPVLVNDHDPDGDSLTISGIATAPSKGTATINTDGTITYTPNSGTTGADTFVYTVVDGFGGSTNASVTIELDNRPPSAADDWFGSSHGAAATLDILFNDFDDDDDPLTVTVSTGPTKGPRPSTAMERSPTLQTPARAGSTRSSTRSATAMEAHRRRPRRS